MIKREDFIKIIKLRSYWKIDKRKGNYELPNEKKLYDYVLKLVNSQMELDYLAISSNGNLYNYIGYIGEYKDGFDYTILKEKPNCDEICSYDEQEKRIKKLVREIVGY